MSYGHRCAAEGCEKVVASEMLMCKRHWFMVPKELRVRIWVGYHRGMDAEYDVAVSAGVDAVREKESRAGGTAP